MGHEEEAEKVGKTGKTRTRLLTVSASWTRCRRKAVPRIRIIGGWLAILGWKIGERVAMEADDESILISRFPPPADQVADAGIYPDEFDDK